MRWEKGIGRFSTAKHKGEKNVRVGVPIRNNETVLLQYQNLMIQNRELASKKYVRETMFSVLQDLGNFFEHFYACSSSAFDFEKIREPREEMDGGESLKKDASNFVNVYQAQCRQSDSFEKRFLTQAQMILHDLEKIEIVPGLNKIGMQLEFRGKKFLLSDLSDGTIEALVILLLLSLKGENNPSLLAIDEPEVNLHPAWQKILANWIQMSGSYDQCFISTHSPDFLDEFTKGYLENKVNIFVADRRSDYSFRPLNYKRVREELEEGWLLGDLYRVNDPSIGGWPW